MSSIVDLRSDTVTQQPRRMVEAMVDAEVGDEYYNEDKEILRLQEKSARMFGKEAGLFVASGTMGNLVSILAHTRRGDEIIIESRAHVLRAEVSNLAITAGILLKQVWGELGIMNAQDIEDAIPPAGLAFPDATLLEIENTHNNAGGTCVDSTQMAEYRKIADKHDLSVHVDGARIFNAMIALDENATDLAKDADSLTFCLSKGLAAPFGAIVVGEEGFIQTARKYKQMLGGGFRQAGYMAAAGIYALDNMIDRIEEDHQNAKFLASRLLDLGFDINMEAVQTNIVFVKPPPSMINAQELVNRLNKDPRIKLNPPNEGRIRLLTHYGIEKEDIEYFIDQVQQQINIQ